MSKHIVQKKDIGGRHNKKSDFCVYTLVINNSFVINCLKPMSL